MTFLLIIGLCVFWTGIWTGAFLTYWFIRERTDEPQQMLNKQEIIATPDVILIENDDVLNASFLAIDGGK